MNIYKLETKKITAADPLDWYTLDCQVYKSYRNRDVSTLETLHLGIEELITESREIGLFHPSYSKLLAKTLRYQAKIYIQEHLYYTAMLQLEIAESTIELLLIEYPGYEKVMQLLNWIKRDISYVRGQIYLY